MGHDSGLRRRSFDVSPSISAEIYDVNTRTGRSFVCVSFEQRLKDGTVKEFRTDLARLEYIERQAREYAASGSTKERYELVGDMHVFIKRGNYPERGNDVGVQVMRKHDDDPREWQKLGTFADNLTATVRESQRFEQEIGYDKRWHVLVDEGSLTKDQAGRIYAQAVKSFESEERAREHLGKSSGLAFYAEPQRHSISKGEWIELWPDANVVVRGNPHTMSVEQQLTNAAWSREREGEHYVVARWNDKFREPSLGQRVTLEGTGYAYNGQPEDFRVGSIGAKEPGDSGQPKWALIEKDPKKPGRGTIRAVSEDRNTITAELKKQEEVQLAVGRDWERQSFEMDRQKYTKGYSL